MAVARLRLLFPQAVSGPVALRRGLKGCGPALPSRGPYPCFGFKGAMFLSLSPRFQSTTSSRSGRTVGKDMDSSSHFVSRRCPLTPIRSRPWVRPTHARSTALRLGSRRFLSRVRTMGKRTAFPAQRSRKGIVSKLDYLNRSSERKSPDTVPTSSIVRLRNGCHRLTPNSRTRAPR